MKEDPRFDQCKQKVQAPQTNIAGNASGPVLSGEFHGPVSIGPSGASSPPVIPHQIPPPPLDFTGREDDIREILASFDRGATITGLRGMGGIGKTALALVLAERLKDRFPDGQLFLNMLGTSKSPLKPEDALAHVIRSYHPEMKMPEDLNGLGGLYRSVLSGKKALILLDNAANREQVEPLLPPSGCALLITSRNKFALPGLEEKDLDVLPLEDAKKLLLEIAGRIGGHAEDLARLCGCLPIALRNAAYALAERKDLGVAEYLERLKDARNRVELVEASFSLSYDLLPPHLQKQWSLLFVFPADFDRAGAAAVWEMDLDPAAEAFSDLVKWSLVDFSLSDGRYHLHDLARDFAASRLETTAKAGAQQRHAEHYRNVLSSSNKLYKQGGDGVLVALQLFDREEANIKVGQAWAEEKLESGSSAAALCSSYPDVGAYVLDLRLHPMEKIAWLEMGLEAAKRLEYKPIEGIHLGNLGRAYILLGKVHKAIEYYEQALFIAREIDDKKNEGTWLSNLGWAYDSLGESRKAIKYYKQALPLSRKIGDKRNEGVDLGNLGQAYYSLGETINAIGCYEQALGIACEIGDKKNEGGWLDGLGVAYADLGDAHRAIEYCRQAIAIAREIGDRMGEGTRLGNLGRSYLLQGKTGKAIEHYEQALEIARELRDQRNEGCWLSNLGKAYADLGDTRKAIEYYDQALAIDREIGDKRGEGTDLFNMSLALDKLGQRPQAVDSAQKALEIIEQIESPNAEAVRRKLAEWQGQGEPAGP